MGEREGLSEMQTRGQGDRWFNGMQTWKGCLLLTYLM